MREHVYEYIHIYAHVHSFSENHAQETLVSVPGAGNRLVVLCLYQNSAEKERKSNTQ